MSVRPSAGVRVSVRLPTAFRRSGGLVRYITVRVVLAVPMVLVVLTLVFAMLRLAPGDPVSASSGGDRLSPEEIAQARHAAGYDRPLAIQYIDYLAHVARLDFGRTISTHQAVSEVILADGGATLTLTTAALLIAVVCGLPLGLVAARFPDRGIDVGVRLFSIATYAVPIFVVGLLAQQVFADRLGWLPLDGQVDPLIANRVPATTHILLLDAVWVRNWQVAGNVLWHLVLPACTLALGVVGVFARIVRVNVIQAMHGDYVEAARARGVSERHVLIGHAFRNALVPVTTVLGIQIAVLLGGAVLTESVYSWPGLGTRTVDFLNNRDYVAVQGIVTFLALTVVAVGVLVDIADALIDPRVRY